MVCQDWKEILAEEYKKGGHNARPSISNNPVSNPRGHAKGQSMADAGTSLKNANIFSERMKNKAAERKSIIPESVQSENLSS